MASNRELIEQAVALGQKLGKPVRTFGLNHAALVQLVEELQEELAERDVVESAVTDPPPAPVLPPPAEELPRPVDGMTGELAREPVVVAPPPAPPRAGPGEVAVAPGKSITSLRGVLGPGTVVSPKDFMHGQETIDHLLTRGTLVSKP